MAPSRPAAGSARTEWLTRDRAVSAALAGLVLALGWLYRDFAHDDAYITYRYARNLAQGLGFVYNPGEAVLGTTTPLYTLLLAFLGRSTGLAIHQLSHLISLASLWGAGVVLYRLGAPRGRQAAVIASLFVSQPLLATSIGMETFFYLFLLLVALWAYSTGRRAVAGVLLGAAMLTRYEAALFAGLLAVDDLLHRRRLPAWPILPGLVLLPWLIFAQATFGSFIPQSAIAKLVATRVPFWLGGAALWWTYARDALWLDAYLALALLGIYALARRQAGGLAWPYRLLLTWSVVYGVAAGLLAGSFPWYYAPLIPGLCIVTAHGAALLHELTRTVLQRLAVPGGVAARQWSPAFLAGVGVLVVGHVSVWMPDWITVQGRVVDRRRQVYYEAAVWLEAHAPADAVLAVGEIGVIGYYSRVRILDLSGLVTPALTDWLRDGQAVVLSNAVRLYGPDYVLWYDGDEAGGALQTRYRPEQTFSLGSGMFTLYRRVAVGARQP